MIQVCCYVNLGRSIERYCSKQANGRYGANDSQQKLWQALAIKYQQQEGNSETGSIIPQTKPPHLLR